MPTKKLNGTKQPAAKQNKSEFVRSLPPNLPAKVVVEKAKAIGLSFSDKYVYNIRHAAKSLPSRKNVSGTKMTTPSSSRTVTATRTTQTTAKVAPAAQSSVAARVGANSHSVEDLLRAVAAELGLGRSLSILETERAKVRAVFSN